MGVRNGQEFAEKWKSRTKGAVADYQRGVEAVTESPTAKAAASSEKWQARMSAAETRKRFEDGLNKVDVNDWKKAALEKGAGRISAGVDGASSKVQEFGEKLLPHVEAGRKEIANMPSLTLDDSINRMVSFTRHMSKFRK